MGEVNLSSTSTLNETRAAQELTATMEALFANDTFQVTLVNMVAPLLATKSDETAAEIEQDAYDKMSSVVFELPLGSSTCSIINCEGELFQIVDRAQESVTAVVV